MNGMTGGGILNARPNKRASIVAFRRRTDRAWLEKDRGFGLSSGSNAPREESLGAVYGPDKRQRQHKGEDYLGFAAPLIKPFGVPAVSERPSPATGFIGSSAAEAFLCLRRY